MPLGDRGGSSRENLLFKRLARKTTKEVLWIYILALLKSKRRYAYEIRTLIREKFDFKIGNVTAYMVLYKLEHRGYVKAEWEMQGNRHRKYYTITPGGLNAFSEGLSYLVGITKDLSAA